MNACVFSPWRAALCLLALSASASAKETLWYDAKGIPWLYDTWANPGEAIITRTPLLRLVSGAVEVPAVIDGYPLTRIDAAVFGACTGITSVTIPASVKFIQSHAFAGSGVREIVFLGDEISTGGILFTYCPFLERVVLPERIHTLGNATFRGCRSLKTIVFPDGTEDLGVWSTFEDCGALEYVWFPPSLSEPWDDTTFKGCTHLQQVVFTGKAPEGDAAVSLIPNGARITYPRADASAWGDIVPESRRGTFTELVAKPKVTVSSRMIGARTMEVQFEVASDSPEVEVRAIALRDGEKSFANVVPIRTLSAGALGKVPANTTNRFVWDIAKDWRADLENARPLILTREDALLPIDEVTLPGEGDLPPFTVNRVPVHETQVLDALLWCYAEGDPRLTVSQGVASVDGEPIAEGDTIVDLQKALAYLFGKMGYRAMTEAEARHWERVTRVSYASYGLENLQVKKQEGE